MSRKQSKSSAQHPAIKKRIYRALDYAFVVPCLAAFVWVKNPWWLAAAAACLIVAIVNPGEWLRRRIVSRLFRSPVRR